MQCLRARTGRAAHAVIAAARRVLDLLEDGGAPYACECGAAQLRGAVVNGDAREYGLVVAARGTASAAACSARNSRSGDGQLASIQAVRTAGGGSSVSAPASSDRRRA